MTIFSLAGRQHKLTAAADAEPHCDELAKLSAVTEIDLSGNTIGIDASEAIARALLRHKDTLERVNFSDIYTGRLNTEIPKSLEHLLPALLQCPRLSHVNLSDNAFGLQTIEPIIAYLGKAVSVEHLILSNNGMGPLAGSKIGESLYKLAQAKQEGNFPSLKTFVCGRNRLENGSANHLAVAFRKHADLREVRLYQNGIRPAGIVKLVLGLAANRKLEVLDLQDNTLTAVGGEALARSLAQWPHLRELNLNDCLLKKNGLLAVAAQLVAVERPLATLKLQYNELETDALGVLAAGVVKLPKLAALELNGNRFEEDDEHVEALAAALEKQGGALDELDELEEVDLEEESEYEYESDGVDLDELEAEMGKPADDNVEELASELAATHIK